MRVKLQKILGLRPDPHLPTHFLLGLIDALMEMNYFRFNESFYLQVRGVAMGSPFAPCAANLFMSAFEQQYILNPTYNPYFGNILKNFRKLMTSFVSTLMWNPLISS